MGYTRLCGNLRHVHALCAYLRTGLPCTGLASPRAFAGQRGADGWAGAAGNCSAGLPSDLQGVAHL